MKRLLGSYLRELRGKESRVQFARRLELSYTFVREMELGNRLPSDEVLLDIGSRLGADPRKLVLFAHCDRSPSLLRVLQEHGVADLLPEDVVEPAQ
jgi:transcriptional regulator with XRE-family HTH domain